MSICELVKSPGVTPVLLLYAQNMLLGLCYTARKFSLPYSSSPHACSCAPDLVNPVFLYTPIARGGVGLSPRVIGIFITLAGASQAMWMLVAFPSLQKQLSTGGLLRLCAYGWVILMLLYPLQNEFRRAHLDPAFWTLSLSGTVFGSSVAMGFACVQLCLNDISPSPSSFGTLNAIALTLNSGTRAVAPMAISSIYATGVTYNILHGHLAWVVMVVLTSSHVFFLRYLPEKAEGRVAKRKAQAVEGEEQ
jgi:hypothetical protein